MISSIHYEYFSTLKSKYSISLVRYVELILCLIVALIPFNLIKNKSLDFDYIVKKFLTYNVFLTIIILLLYAIDIVLKLHWYRMVVLLD